MECHVVTVGLFIFFAQINTPLDITSKQHGPNRRRLNVLSPYVLSSHLLLHLDFLPVVNGDLSSKWRAIMGWTPWAPSSLLNGRLQPTAHIDWSWQALRALCQPLPLQVPGQVCGIVILSSPHSQYITRGVSKLCQHQGLRHQKCIIFSSAGTFSFVCSSFLTRLR